MPASFLFVTLLAFFAPFSAPAALASTLDDVTYDFVSRSLTVRGYYVPKQGDAKSGLAAELEARQNGVTALTRHLGKVCEGGTDNSHLASGWQRSLRSQGSEIYSNGVLKIILTSDLDKVFKGYSVARAKKLRTPEGEPIVFRLPALPQGSISCGSANFEFAGKKYAVSPVALPVEAGARRVNLLLGAGGVLKVSSPEDVSLLEKAKFPTDLQSEGEGLPLPVVGG